MMEGNKPAARPRNSYIGPIKYVMQELKPSRNLRERLAIGQNGELKLWTNTFGLKKKNRNNLKQLKYCIRNLWINWVNINIECRSDLLRFQESDI